MPSEREAWSSPRALLSVTVNELQLLASASHWPTAIGMLTPYQVVTEAFHSGNIPERRCTPAIHLRDFRHSVQGHAP